MKYYIENRIFNIDIILLYRIIPTYTIKNTLGGVVGAKLRGEVNNRSS